jgi:hypothetical protein
VIFCELLTRSSSPSGLLIWCGIGFCAGIGLFFYGFRLLQRRRLILDTPFSKIRSASLGMVEVSGLAVGPYTMIAPITAKPCYYYRTVVWEWKRTGKNHQWVKIAAECMHVPFFLDDNTGRLLVDPRGADLDLHRDFQQEFCDSYFTTKEPAPDNVRRFLVRNRMVTNNKIKVEEFCIKPKNALFVLGTLAENPGLEVTATPVRDSADSSHGISMTFGSSFSGTMSFGGGDFDAGSLIDRMMGQNVPSSDSRVQVIRLSSEAGPANSIDMSQQQKISAALLRAGISNPEAWSAAGLGVPAVQVNEDPAAITGATGPNGSGAGAAKSGFDSHPPVVLMKGTNSKTFLISWRSQQDIARSLGWKCTLMIWGGPALALLSLYILLSIENWL